ncbi:hypothetical protein LQ953_05515 [Sphingomonas sp. IC-56]|nr:hypothetical protein [Sphingomonas sp. IC-56]
MIEFDRAAVVNNFRVGRQTNIIFDTNVMIEIEMAYRTEQPHNKLKEAGIAQFAKMISKYSKYGVFISPGAAYQELPPARRGAVEIAFSKMLRYYLPHFRYDPNARPMPFTGESTVPEVFSELPSEMQEFKSCPYASLMAINIIHRSKILDPIEKFIAYIDYCSEVLNLISVKEASIARYVFSPDVGMTDSLRDRKNAIMSNFAKIKKGGGKGLSTSELIKRISLNGANDLIIITAADVVNNTRKQNNHDLIEHDVWIATSDEKLYAFCRACPSFLLEDRTGAMARFLDVHEDITGTRYWKKSAEILAGRLQERRSKVGFNDDMSVIVQAALQAEALLLEGDAESFFQTRSWRHRP